MSREFDRQRTPGHALSWCGRTRREFLWEAGGGFVGTALATLLADDGFFGRSAIASTPDAMTDSPLVPKRPHFPAKAKACIVLFMYGGVSQVDTFDPKPELIKHHGKPIPPDVGDPVLKAQSRHALGVIPQIHAAWPIGDRDFGPLSPLGRVRRRPGGHPQHAHRQLRSWLGPASDEHGLCAPGISEPRLMGDLRTGDGQSRSAGLCGDA